MDEIRLRGETSELKDETTQLARQYGIVTPYTAYLITEDERKRDVPLAIQSFPALQSDSVAFDDAAKSYSAMNTLKDGVGGVSEARATFGLRNAASPVAAAAGVNQEQSRAYKYVVNSSAPAQAEAKTRRMEQYTQQQRFVNGRT